jgi:flagellar basal body rod protein FlgC
MRNAIFLVIFSTISSFAYCDEFIDIMLYDQKQIGFYNKYLKSKNIEYFQDNIFIKIQDNIFKNIIKDIMEIENLKIQVIRDNINNYKTTRTAAGSAFKRKYITINVDGKIAIEEDNQTSYRFEYDPIHPDAIRNGDKIGYVEYPNIDLENEYNDLISTIQLFNSLVEYANNNHLNIVVEKYTINTIEDIRYRLYMEKSMEILLLDIIKHY